MVCELARSVAGEHELGEFHQPLSLFGTEQPEQLHHLHFISSLDQVGLILP